ncbi:stage II sporulation protein M [Paenibacillus sp. JX-17]|uniref:Stage II sporulation protein M n=1 Tax=Paenibacillus lacisoli TaxID=3064525 RepID=A0ABT9C7A3_9BACL|nr:stage II sporulation protein M [Paenibacillus sp. JX-17]MDO7905136.1 stage II sporulation protein M [Paenibacillus sp. JX-17]
MQLLRHTLKDQSQLYVFVAVLFLVGVVFGALMVNALSLEQQQDLARYLGNFFRTVSQTQEAGGEPGPGSYWDIATLHLKWAGIIWVLGLSVIGLPGILILDFLKGVLIGFTVGYLVGQYAWKGLLFSLVAVAPHNLIVIPALFVCSVAAVSFSLQMIRSRVLTQRQGGLARPLLSYTALTAVMVAILLGISSFEVWVTPVMMKWVAPMLVASTG